MRVQPERITDSTIAAGLRLRCFLNAALQLFLVIGLSGAMTAFAMDCNSKWDMKLSRVQGTVYGPSGLTVPEIRVWVERTGKIVAKTQTDGRGRFELKVAPGNYVVHLQYLGSKPMDLNVRVGRGFFHAPRLRIVLGLSGTRCSFATTSSKQFKNEMKRYQKQLEEVRAEH